MPIFTHGLPKAKVNLYNRTKIIEINIVPDSIISDILLGRDMLSIFEIKLHFRELKLRDIVLKFRKDRTERTVRECL